MNTLEDTMKLEKIRNEVLVGINEFLSQNPLKNGDIFVLGLSTSEVQGEFIGKQSNIDIGRVIVRTLYDRLKKDNIYLAVQGCEHLNRALVIEKEIAEQLDLEIVSVYPSIHAGGAGQIAAFEIFNDPVEVEHITAKGGMDIGDTSIGMHVKFVQIPIRTSIKNIGKAHTTYLGSRPKLIGGPRAKYVWDPFK